MSVINPLAREISAKIVYYGPGLSGKTTSLHAIYAAVRPERRGELVSLATETDRTIFFDFLPLRVERVQGLGLRFQLYTVPGQVFYGATRRLVLNGADGVVFVADSQPNCHDSNLESFESLRTNMTELGIDIEDFPLVFQYNKRDLPNAVAVKELSSVLNHVKAPEFGTCATTGDGVLTVLRAITKLVIRSLTEQQPAMRRQIVDDDDQGSGELDSIASSVYHISRKLSAERQPTSPTLVSTTQAALVAAAHAARTPAAPPALGSAAQSTHGTAAQPARTPAAVPARGASVPLALVPAAVTPAEAPLASAAANDATARSTGRRFSFAPLWPAQHEPKIREIEDAIASGEPGNAVRIAALLLAETIDSVPGLHGGAATATKAALLCLDGGLYLRVCRLATMPAEAVTEADALLALHVLVSARLKVQSLGQW